MKIAILGSRGIPSLYGGYERFTEALAPDLSRRGNDVFVSCEGTNEKNPLLIYKGVNIFYFPFLPPRSYTLRKFYEVVYDGYSLLKMSRDPNIEIIYMLGYGASIFFFIPMLFNKILVVNSDGIEWKRPKFNIIEKKLMLICERLMVIFADKIVADSDEIRKYFYNIYGLDVKFIPYGVSEIPTVIWEEAKLPSILMGNIRPNDYWLVAARLEPENNIHTIVKAYIESNSKRPLIIVGDFSSLKYENLVNCLLADKLDVKKIIIVRNGYDGHSLNMLRQNCFAYIHGHSVGGTSPALLVPMIMKKLILINDNEFTREVCGNFGVYFSGTEDLSKKINMVEENPKNYSKLSDGVYKRARNNYSWEKILDKYDMLFHDLIR